MFLTQHTAPGLFTYHESDTDENSSLLWQRTRGWDVIKYITPHGWTAAELSMLLRSCLIREEGDALVIGSGVPDKWMDSDFSVQGMPTYFGCVSFEYKAAGQTLTVYVSENIRVVNGLPRDVNLVIVK